MLLEIKKSNLQSYILCIIYACVHSILHLSCNVLAISSSLELQHRGFIRNALLNTFEKRYLSILVRATRKSTDSIPRFLQNAFLPSPSHKLVLRDLVDS